MRVPVRGGVVNHWQSRYCSLAAIMPTAQVLSLLWNPLQGCQVGHRSHECMHDVMMSESGQEMMVAQGVGQWKEKVRKWHDGSGRNM